MDVQTPSPQLDLATLSNASCCTVSDMFLIAYDPKTDFVVSPWLEKTIGGELRLGEVIGGTDVFVPAGEEKIKLYGYPVELKANLEPTGTGLDRSLFLTIETAREMARISRTRAEKPLEIPQDSVSAVMVKVRPGSNPRAVALNISVHIKGGTKSEYPFTCNPYIFVNPISASPAFAKSSSRCPSDQRGFAASMQLTLHPSLLPQQAILTPSRCHLGTAFANTPGVIMKSRERRK